MSVTVTLRFKSTAERDYFMGQLSDGWGENEVSLLWGDGKESLYCALERGEPVDVDPTVSELWQEKQRIRRKLGEVIK